ncbi:type I polyketide synthase [Roseibium sp. Sym1]|uniref:type I polyketide synthase n=1 Tax=Roseibium sp. Sym1 TaxID=3016006 RepID=UPI0022B5CF99|nr:type I polyketide synthase [Roseibium sp. Sym1]
MMNNDHDTHTNDIAIIGWSLRLPGADTCDAYWDNLRNKTASVSFFSEEEVLAAGVSPKLARDKNFIKARAILEDVGLFDAEFFGYSPREAEIMDPQQRVLLECAWQAMEDGGYAGSLEDDSRVGVFGCSSMSSYLFSNVMTGRSDIDPFHALLGNDRNHLATRIAYKLNLAGPAVNIQTACSASLVAVHYGCQALLNGECDMSIVGGASITVPQKSGHPFVEEGIYAPDGMCRAFDARAHGIVGGNGVVVVLLKRMEEAVADRDTIHAVIRGSATNNDGARKAGYTAPSVDGQIDVISEALAISNVAPETIGYVEAHGTATLIGDPIEVEALTRAYRQYTDRTGYCGIGSVKSNIGHLDAAAGLAGLVKASLALKHGEIPPTLHVTEPNPKIDFAATPFYVATECKPWPRGDSPRRAGVSAFGLGGSNCHVVLEEPPSRPAASRQTRAELIVLSGRTPTALARQAEHLAKHVETASDRAVPDIAYTLQMGRRHLTHRGFCVADGAQQLSSKLHRNGLRSSVCPGDGPPRIVYAFPGLGEHFPGMGKGLYETEAVYRDVVDRTLAQLQPHFETDLHEALLGGRDEGGAGKGIDFRGMVLGNKGRAASAATMDLQLQHSLLFVTELALARLYQGWGLGADGVLGYSLGEITAACIAGVFDEDGALKLVRERAALITACPPGSAAAVQLTPDIMRDVLPEGCAIAGENAPNTFTVAGTAEAIDALEDRVAKAGGVMRKLPIGRAVHTPALAEAVGPLKEILRTIDMSRPAIPVLSNLEGAWADPDHIASPEYWLEHMVRPVRMEKALNLLATGPHNVVLELGPGRSFSAWARQVSRDLMCLSALGHRYEQIDAREQVLQTVGSLWAAGAEPDWPQLHRGQGCGRVPLPTYPFERKLYWIDARPKTAKVPAGEPERKADLADWFYLPSWQRAEGPARGPSHNSNAKTWLLISDGSSDERMSNILRSQGISNLKTLWLGDLRDGDRAASSQKAKALLEDLKRREAFPDSILWLPAHTSGNGFNGKGAMERLGTGIAEVLVLAQALADVAPARNVDIAIATFDGQDVESRDIGHVDQAAIAALRLVVPQEYPNQRWRIVDIQHDDARALEGLAMEWIAETRTDLVALRGGLRWTHSFAPVKLPPAQRPVVREGDTYLVLGGLGTIGLTLAGYAAREARINLILAGDIGLTDDDVARGPGDAAPQQDKDLCAQLHELMACGTNIKVLDADLADEAAAQEVLARAKSVTGKIDVVIFAPGKAGLDGLASVSEASEALVNWHVEAKLAPLVRMAPLIDEAAPGSVVVTSSLSPVLGGLGMAAHASVHTAIDAFVRHKGRSGSPWITVNWNWADQSRNSKKSQLADLTGATVRSFEISNAEGAETFARVLDARPAAQVVVSSGALKDRIEQWTDLDNAAGPSSVASPEGTVYARPDIETPFVEPRGKIEKLLADIWAETLGVECVGANDSFFDLGGHSLVGAQTVVRLREIFGVNVSLKAMFTDPTLRASARVIEDLLDESADHLEQEKHAG